MKFFKLYRYLPLGILLVSAHSYSQQHIVDSLYSVLRTEKEDTNKVKTLYLLVDKLEKQGNLHAADSIAQQSLVLSEKCNYKKGEMLAYKAIGIIDYDEGNYTEELKNLFHSLSICKEISDKQDLCSIYNNIGLCYCQQGNFNQSEKFLLQSINIGLEIDNKKVLASAYGNLGMVYNDQGNGAEALKNLLLSLSINERINDKRGMSRVYSNIGLIYESQNNYAEALKDYNQSLLMGKELGNKKVITGAYNNIGNIYGELGKYYEALAYYLQTLDIAKQAGNKYDQCNAYINIGMIYFLQKKYDEALKSQLQGLSLSKEIGDKYNMAYSYCSMGNTLVKMKKYADAKPYFNQGMLMAKEIGAKDAMKELYNGITIFDSATADYQNAFKDYKLYVKYRDSIINKANTQKIVSEQMTFEFKRQQDSVKAEQAQKDLLVAADKKKQETITWSVCGGLLLVMIFAGFIFRSLRITRKQKHIIEVKNKETEEQKKNILDSITYAKRLQDAILPPLSIIKKYLPDSFLLYKPKDIVAGDFYWLERAGDTVLIAACDCTGHGVPGALVSVVCSNALNRTVKEFKITEPGKILDKVRELVLETFEKSESEVQDGMDISLCCLNTKTKEIQWSGAYNSLLYIQHGELHEVLADKQPIGKTNITKPFNTHNLNLQKGDTLYLFTDGYADQFGGSKGKKFKYKQLQEKLLAMASIGMDKQKEMLDETIESWKGNLEQVDDILIMGIRI